MRTIAIMNQKGGSAKTTTAVNLAATLVARGKKVLLVDIDPQGSGTQWLRCNTGKDGKAGKTVYDIFTGNATIDAIAMNTCIDGLDVAPSCQRLIGAEKLPAGEIASESVLKRALAKASAKWDYILFDCPPALGILSLNALVAAREVLIPVEVSVMALQGLVGLMETIEKIRERINPELKITGILPCRVDRRTRLSVDVIDKLKRFGDTVCKTHIRETVRLAECPSFGKPITEYDPQGRGALDYGEPADEILQQEVAGCPDGQ